MKKDLSPDRVSRKLVTLLDGTPPSQPNQNTTTNTMTTKSKAYSSASNAKRAAKAAGLALDGFDITSDAHGHYYTARKSTPAPAAKASKPAAKKAAKPTPVVEAPKPAVVNKPTETAHSAAEAANFPELAIVRKSVIQNPVEWVWNFFDAEKKAADERGEKISRKGSIAKAVQAGIAFYTARTQYQSWKTANKF